MGAGNIEYRAFLSYSHSDHRLAASLHRALEAYRVPAKLVGTPTPAGPVPTRLAPIFRDREELALAASLSQSIELALSQSAALIVICSPAAAASRWVNEEVRTFKKIHGDSRVFAVIGSGEPWASRVPGRDEQECFPAAIRFDVDGDGNVTDSPAEPIAADLRKEGDGKRNGQLKLIASLLGVRLDDLIQRETQRRNRRLRFLAAASLAGMAVTTGLSVVAVQARMESEEQRGAAEGLIEYMLTDLRQKLEPVGRLNALDGVGHRALDYYDQQQLQSLDSDSLGRRSRALLLIGEMRNLRGDTTGALSVFRRAAATTGELLARAPDQEQQIFDHSQSVFWVGYVGWQRGRLDEAERSFRDYHALAGKLVAANPKRAKWQMEAGHAAMNLGTLLLERGDVEVASAMFRSAAQSYGRAGRGDDQSRYYAAQAAGWSARAHEDLGQLGRALQSREEQVRIYQAMPEDARAQAGLAVAFREVGRLSLALGRTGPARDFAERSVQLGAALLRLEPENRLWAEMALSARIEQAATLVALGNRTSACVTVDETLADVEEMVRRDRTNVQWQTELRAPVLLLASRCAAPAEVPRTASLLEKFLVDVARLPVTDRAQRVSIARARAALADLIAGSRPADALRHRRAAQAALAEVVLPPASLGALQKAKLLEQLGRARESRALLSTITRTEFRHPALGNHPSRPSASGMIGALPRSTS